MSERSPTTPRSWRSAALGALGGLMVLLPLGEVMRHQTQEFQLLSAERAQLDPLALAVGVQRGLLSHGELCQRLLSGRTALEPERQLRQAVVDNALWDLKNTLAAGLWVAALGEAGQLGLDWRALTQRIQARTVDLKSSQAEHRLLIEQTLQVMDLVTAAAPATGAQLRLALHRATPASIDDEHNSQRAQALTLARLQDQIQAHSQSLDERLIGLLAARAWLGAAAAALLVLAAAALLMRRSGTVPSPVPPAAQDGVRLGQGRRATDADRAPNAASRLMWQLRQGPSRSSAAYPDTLPPPP
jgi:hypothetical protein